MLLFFWGVLFVGAFCCFLLLFFMGFLMLGCLFVVVFFVIDLAVCVGQYVSS